MTTTVAKERAIPRLALVGIFGGLFTGYLGLTSVIPVLPGFVRNHLGAPDIVVGLAITATSLTALLTRPLAGKLADSRGRKGVMRLGALIVGAGGLLYFAPLGIAGLISVRLLLGVGEASLFTAGAAWTVSLAPHQRRGQLIGLYGVSMWGGISLGTLCGAALQHVGYAAVWAFSAAVPLVGLVLISLVPAPERPAAPPAPAAQAQATDGSTTRTGFLATLLPRPVILPGIALTFGAAGYAGLASFIVLFLKSRGIGSGVLVLSEFSAVYVLQRFQRRGIGLGLMHGVAAALLENGVDMAALWCLKDNTGARRFYERLGGEFLLERAGPEIHAGQIEIVYGWRDLAAQLEVWSDANQGA